MDMFSIWILHFMFRVICPIDGKNLFCNEGTNGYEECEDLLFRTLIRFALIYNVKYCNLIVHDSYLLVTF